MSVRVSVEYQQYEAFGPLFYLSKLLSLAIKLYVIKGNIIKGMLLLFATHCLRLTVCVFPLKAKACALNK